MESEEIKINLIDPAKLRRARGDRELIDVAQATGITTMHLRYIESGQRRASDRTLQKLCRLYGVKPQNLISENFLATS